MGTMFGPTSKSGGFVGDLIPGNIFCDIYVAQYLVLHTLCCALKKHRAENLTRTYFSEIRVNKTHH